MKKSSPAPVYLAVPYVLGNFSPSRAEVARESWRLVMPVVHEGKSIERIRAVCQALGAEVAAVRAAGDWPVVFMGDCTQTIGLLAGLQRDLADLLLVWYDAHGDFNTWETSPSGFVGGMPLAMLCGRGEQTIVQKAGANLQPEANIILTDARDLDPGEKEAVAGSGLTHLPAVADLLNLNLPDKPIYIHFDSDVLSLADLAAVNYPAEGGASLATIEASLIHLVQTGRVAALSVTLWNPELDDEAGRGGRVVLDLVDRIVGQLARQPIDALSFLA
jgi:arginase